MKISVLTPSIRPAGLEITRKCLMEQSEQDFEWLVELGLGRHDLNAAYNRMLRRAQGELVVSVQDYIQFPATYLEQFWEAYQAHPTTFFTAPVGKSSQEDYGGDIRWDWRAMGGAVRWDSWEIDSGAAPLAALKQIGGFDEALDGHWSCDNVNVGCRAELAGFSFKNLPNNCAIAYDHDAHMPHPYRSKYDPRENTKRMAMFRGGFTLPPLH